MSKIRENKFSKKYRTYRLMLPQLQGGKNDHSVHTFNRFVANLKATLNAGGDVTID